MDCAFCSRRYYCCAPVTAAAVETARLPGRAVLHNRVKITTSPQLNGSETRIARPFFGARTSGVSARARSEYKKG